MQKHFTYSAKSEGDSLTHTEWNNLAQDVDAAVDAINNGSSNSHISFDSTGKHNLNITTTSEDQYNDNGDIKGGKINIEPISDLQIKAADDIVLSAHHRAVGDNDKILIKVVTEATGIKKGSVITDKEIPANLKINSGDITITNKDNVNAVLVEINTNYTKNKQDYNVETNFTQGTFENGTIYEFSQLVPKLDAHTYTEKSTGNTKYDSDVELDIMNMAVGKNRKIAFQTQSNPNVYTCYTFTKVSKPDGVTNISIEDSEGYGYLKLRAQSIDLRCEDHGGIAIQPKGLDGSGYENKIKFEHGGGDGLEFGTFNSEKTSLFTDQYRFNKKGQIFLATRTKEISNKYDASDVTTHYKYVKNQDDDFYDNINSNDPHCTWQDILTYIDWAKNNAEGPFTLDYLLNSQLPAAGYIYLKGSMINNDASSFANNIASITVSHFTDGTGESVTLIKDPSSNISFENLGMMQMCSIPFVTEQNPGTASILGFTYNPSTGVLKMSGLVTGGDYDNYTVTQINYVTSNA